MLEELLRPGLKLVVCGTVTGERSTEPGQSSDLREIDSAASKITVLGARCPEQIERMTGR